ncbi:MAG: hypothetical protein WC867_06105 [Candidatus Pacearchaeota archaeon]|jgi:hypothetical protein
MKTEKISKIIGSLLIMFSIFGIFIIYNGGISGRVIGTGSSSYEPNKSLSSNNILLTNEFSNGLNNLQVKSIKESSRLLTINYIFDSSDYFGSSTSVEFWITDPNKVEIRRIVDTFPINKEKKENLRSINLNLKGRPAGVYKLNMAMSADTKKMVSQSIVLGESFATGNTILENPRNKIIGYVIFLIFIAIGIFFIFRNKDKDSLDSRIDKVKTVNKSSKSKRK